MSQTSPAGSAPHPDDPAPPATEATEATEAIPDCSNCGQPLAAAGEGARYCPSCGQRVTEGRLTLRQLARALEEHLLPGGRGFLHTVLALLRSPGGVVREYTGGRRRAYVNPLSYLFVTAATSLVLFNLIGGFDTDQMRAQLAANAEATQPGISAAQIERSVEVQVKMFQHATTLSLLLGIPLTLFLRLTFWRTLNTAESLVFSLYLLGQVFVLDLATYLLFLLTEDVTWHTATTQIIYLVTAIWFGATFQRPRWLGALKALAAFLLAFLVFAVAVTTALSLYLRA
ncbi:MAG: DUF3667 domain-containing protein [Acidobacteria bacterium]|nr:MAG: DUF3667 domain-containing protein [Acidobacteriota bacterium]REK07675.1 MAG: DUF3667 domain-containing protein [Acidobacteriota bacterium]